MNSLLVEYVGLVCERMRSVREKFSWQEFLSVQENLPDNEAAKRANEYAASTLAKLGSGSSRDTYVLTSRFVLKIAKFGGVVNGVMQNKKEKEAYESHSDLPLTRVLTSDPRNVWLVSELVNPIKNDEEFKKITGYNELELDDMCKFDIGEKTTFKPKKKQLATSTFLQLLKRMNDSGIDVGDLISHEQWGKNAEGEIKLLDSGL